MPFDIELLRPHFPPDTTLPPLLERFSAFASEIEERTGVPLDDVLNFELDDVGDGLFGWFGTDEELASKAIVQLAPFGTDATGSIFAFWLYDGRTLETAPIVALDSEGTDSEVLTNTLGEFFHFLAVEDEELLEDFDEDEMTAFHAYQEWVARECPPAADAETIYETAQSTHPDFLEWVSEYSS